MRQVTWILAVGAVVLTAACGGAGEPVTPTSPTTTGAPSSEPTHNTDVISGNFDIGGRELRLRCLGTGSPTILLESGDESGVEDWDLVAPALTPRTQTCAYDRAGVGRSADATGCRDLDDLLADLEALLLAAEIEGPYVLVGASGGGYLAAGFAARHPGDVAGLVLVDTFKAITTMSPELAAALRCDAPSNVERRDYYAVEHAVWDNRAEIGDFPMTIISNDYGADAPAGDEQTNVADQRGWLVLSPSSKQVVVTSGHDVPFNQPDLVVAEILEVLDAARAG